ncbi:hypothetical protein HYQ46_006062 [Verticillium longisporum]|nr:hypothetical protein HYQ44_018631 [Verticillium longisporum]KAG7145198.1 hypothetical protein HYQ46_006062 [Verticillium longisporum]
MRTRRPAPGSSQGRIGSDRVLRLVNEPFAFLGLRYLQRLGTSAVRNHGGAAGGPLSSSPTRRPGWRRLSKPAGTGPKARIPKKTHTNYDGCERHGLRTRAANNTSWVRHAEDMAQLGRQRPK